MSENESEWRTLQRYLARPVYEGWKFEVEAMVASKKGIVIPEDKQSREACAAYTAIYECMLEHFRQYSDEQWRNF